MIWKPDENTLVCIAFQRCLWRKCFPPSKGVGGKGVDKGQGKKGQQSPCFKERAADTLIISNSFFWYPGDQHRIYSFSCTWHSRYGDGCQSPFGWRRGVSEGKDAGTKPNSNPLKTISSLWFLSKASYFSQSPRPETKNHPGALSLVPSHMWWRWPSCPASTTGLHSVFPGLLGRPSRGQMLWPPVRPAACSAPPGVLLGPDPRVWEHSALMPKPRSETVRAAPWWLTLEQGIQQTVKTLNVPPPVFLCLYPNYRTLGPQTSLSSPVSL